MSHKSLSLIRCLQFVAYEDANIVWINATYQGPLIESRFAELWTSIPNEILVNYFENTAIEKQRKNPQYGAYINFAFDRTGVFVEYPLGTSSYSLNGSAASNPENPFNPKEINPLN